MIDPFLLKLQSKRNKQNYPAPFHNRTFSLCTNDFFTNDDYDDDNRQIISLHNENNFLSNYTTLTKYMMDQEVKSRNKMNQIGNKFIQLKNREKEYNKKYLIKKEYYKMKSKAEDEYYASELENIINNKENEKLERKNNINLYKKKTENEKQFNKKKLEQRAINKRNKQNEILNNIKNESDIAFSKYKKDKILQKEKKDIDFKIKKNKLELDTKLKLNELKKKAELVPKLIFYFENSK